MSIIDLTLDEKINMSLDEIQAHELKNKKIYKKPVTFNSKKNINNILYSWVIHIDSDSDEYVTGYRKRSNNLFETSTIKHKIPMSDHLLIITENESLYKLYYKSSYY